MKEKCSNITIVGSGAAGLMTATRLSERGYQVTVIEKSDKLCAGPSIKNEGWLHPGTYHATSIKDQDTALEVAERCKYGYTIIKALAPEAIEEPEIKSFAVFKDENYAEYAQERWDAANVFFDAVVLRELVKYCPEINIDRISRAFQVNDLSINTPRLYQNLVDRTLEKGGEFLLQSRLELDEHQQAWICSETSAERIPLNTQMVINTTGYGMAEYLKLFFGEEFSMRFWKSHLILYPRLGKHNVFYIEPGEAAAIQHGRVTMVGQHEDAAVSELPDFSPIPENASKVRAATAMLYPAAATSTYLDTACLKPDITRNSAKARSLGIEVYEPQPGFIFALPGKMTESPCLADELVRLVESRNLQRMCPQDREKTVVPISTRPCDDWQW